MSKDKTKYKAYNEYSPEELEEMKRKIREDKIEREIFNKRCEEIKKIFERGELSNLKPFWHIVKEDIDFSSQPHQLEERFLIEGYTIGFFDVENVLNSMRPGNPELFRERKMFHDEWSCSNICRVIDAWLTNTKLIPPTLIISDVLNQTFLVDGKHRFNVAYCLDEHTIPIIIPNIQLEIIKGLIG